MPNGIERRGFARYAVRAAAHFKWIDVNGTVRCGQGLTRDINSRGMFIYSEAQPMLATDIEVEVRFSTVSDSIKLIMKATGAVIRWEEPQDGIYYGFAVLNRDYSLQSDVIP